MPKFRDLAIGDTFTFENETGVNGLMWQGAYGPWVKLSARRYVHARDNWVDDPVVHRVGSINVQTRLY